MYIKNSYQYPWLPGLGALHVFSLSRGNPSRPVLDSMMSWAVTHCLELTTEGTRSCFILPAKIFSWQKHSVPRVVLQPKQKTVIFYQKKIAKKAHLRTWTRHSPGASIYPLMLICGESFWSYRSTRHFWGLKYRNLPFRGALHNRSAPP